MHTGCKIIWASNIQYLIAPSTTEDKYISLSIALREVIGIVNLLEELKVNGFNVHPNTSKGTFCTFEENKICIEISTNHRTKPRTKHFSARLHHFFSHVVRKTITIEYIFTKYQVTDIFTKLLRESQFYKLASLLMHWTK